MLEERRMSPTLDWDSALKTASSSKSRAGHENGVSRRMPTVDQECPNAARGLRHC